MNFQTAGAPVDDLNPYGLRRQPPPTTSLTSPPLYRVLLPALLTGTRCYTDASTTPESSPSSAGLQSCWSRCVHRQHSAAAHFFHLHQRNYAQHLFSAYGWGGSFGLGGFGGLCNGHSKSNLPNRQPTIGDLQWLQSLIASTLGYQTLYSEVHQLQCSKTTTRSSK